MEVLLFAGLAEACGVRRIRIEGAPLTVAAVRAAAEAAHPALRGRRYGVAVAARWARDEDAVPAGAEVALLPPVSGG